MRVGVILHQDRRRTIQEIAAEVRAYEQAGASSVTLGEAYTFDAVSQIGYLAACTSTIELATGVLPLGSRTPTLLGMTAAGLDYVSGGRLRLGVGVSGPAVMEGFHGAPFGKPLARIRESLEICRQVLRRERLSHVGPVYRVPYSKEAEVSDVQALKLIQQPVRDTVPISIAALGPASVKLAAEIADGWEPYFFHPEMAQKVWGEALREGSLRRDHDLGALEVIVRMPALVTDDLEAGLAAAKPHLALYIGGMGSAHRNYYADLVGEFGFASEAAEIQRHFREGRKSEAAKAVPDDLVRGMSLIGSAGWVRDRIAALGEAGVSLVNIVPIVTPKASRSETVATFVKLGS